MREARTLDELSECIAELMVTTEWQCNEFLGEQIEMIFDRIKESGWELTRRDKA